MNRNYANGNPYTEHWHENDMETLRIERHESKPMNRSALDHHIMSTFHEYWDAERRGYNDDADPTTCPNCGSYDVELVAIGANFAETIECQQCGDTFHA